MTPIQEVFLERHGDDTSIALQHCNIRKAELEAQRFLCTIENLYTVNGDRVFILIATLPHATELRGEFSKIAPLTRSTHPKNASSRLAIPQSLPVIGQSLSLKRADLKVDLPALGSQP